MFQTTNQICYQQNIGFQQKPTGNSTGNAWILSAICEFPPFPSTPGTRPIPKRPTKQGSIRIFYDGRHYLWRFIRLYCNYIIHDSIYGDSIRIIPVLKGEPFAAHWCRKVHDWLAKHTYHNCQKLTKYRRNISCYIPINSTWNQVSWYIMST